MITSTLPVTKTKEGSYGYSYSFSSEYSGAPQREERESPAMVVPKSG
jgi:hypothetical protein